MGIVQLERNRGIKIVEANTRDLQVLFQLRLMVEVPATFRAVHRNIDAGLIYRLETELTAMGQAAKAIIALIEQSEIELEQFRSSTWTFCITTSSFISCSSRDPTTCGWLQASTSGATSSPLSGGGHSGSPAIFPDSTMNTNAYFRPHATEIRMVQLKPCTSTCATQAYALWRNYNVRIPMRAHSIPHGTKAFPSRDTSATQSSDSSRWFGYIDLGNSQRP
jgi:hypothetical protein